MAGQTVLGLRELGVALADLDRKGARAALSPAMRKAAKLWEAEARRRAPRRTGTFSRRTKAPGKKPAALVEVRGGALARSITTRLKINLNKGEAFARVGPKRAKGDSVQTPGGYGLMVEFGTKHSAPKPYLRPAFDSQKQPAIEVFKKELEASIAKVAARHAR